MSDENRACYWYIAKPNQDGGELVRVIRDEPGFYRIRDFDNMPQHVSEASIIEMNEQIGVSRCEADDIVLSSMRWPEAKAKPQTASLLHLPGGDFYSNTVIQHTDDTNKNVKAVPQHMLYRVTLTKTTTETREFIVYAQDDFDAIIESEQNEMDGNGTSDFVLHDSEWEECDVSQKRDIEELPHEVMDYAPEIAELNLDARLATASV